MLLIYIYSGPVKVLSVIEERINITWKGKYPLSFQIWIFRNGQPDQDDHRRILVSMISTKEQVALFEQCFRQWLSSVHVINVLDTIITYGLWNVNSICWWCWNIATACPSGAHEFTPGLSGVRVTRSLVLVYVFIDRCLSFCPLSFGHCLSVLLRYADSDYPFGVFKMVI